MPDEEFLHELQVALPHEKPRPLFRTLLSWGRYAEIITYDQRHHLVRLYDGRRMHKHPASPDNPPPAPPPAPNAPPVQAEPTAPAMFVAPAAPAAPPHSSAEPPASPAEAHPPALPTVPAEPPTK